MQGVADGDEVRSVVERRLIPLIRQAHPVEGHSLQVSCSVGMAIYPDDSTDLDELMRQADAAMYEAKSSGRDTARFFSPEIDQSTRERQEIEQYLRQALAHEELSVHYQPRIDANTLAVVGLEALLRWQHPVLGSVSPARFIPVAEETGLIHPIGQWVIQQACEQIARWGDEGLPPLVVSVNLSAAQLTDEGLVSHLQTCLRANRVDPGRLELELTESQLMEHAAVSGRLLTNLKALGVQLSIDDFGTGYSSLAYLKKFPISKLKIDQSFVRGLPGDDSDVAIVAAMIGLARAMGLSVIAEGVETEDQRAALLRLGCDEYQGFLFSPGVSAAKFAGFLQGPARVA